MRLDPTTKILDISFISGIFSGPAIFKVSLVKVSDVSRKPFCFRFVFSYYSLLRFPTLVGNLSVFVLSFLIKVSDVSRKPFCFRFVFSYYYSLFFILYFSSLFSTSLSIHNFVNFQPIDFKFSTNV